MALENLRTVVCKFLHMCESSFDFPHLAIFDSRGSDKPRRGEAEQQLAITKGSVRFSTLRIQQMQPMIVFVDFAKGPCFLSLLLATVANRTTLDADSAWDQWTNPLTKCE